MSGELKTASCVHFGAQQASDMAQDLIHIAYAAVNQEPRSVIHSALALAETINRKLPNEHKILGGVPSADELVKQM